MEAIVVAPKSNRLVSNTISRSFFRIPNYDAAQRPRTVDLGLHPAKLDDLVGTDVAALWDLEFGLDRKDGIVLEARDKEDPRQGPASKQASPVDCHAAGRCQPTSRYCARRIYFRVENSPELDLSYPGIRRPLADLCSLDPLNQTLNYASNSFTGEPVLSSSELAILIGRPIGLRYSFFQSIPRV